MTNDQNYKAPSVCPLDCPDTCSLEVTVEEGRLVKVAGSHANPYTAGSICTKVQQYYPDFVHGKERLTTPLRRIGAKGEGKFEEISWEDALKEVHSKFSNIIEEHSSEAIMPFNYSGPHGQLAGGSMDRRFFNKLGASQINPGPLCAGIWGVAYDSLYGAVPGIAPEYVDKAELLVIWGNNTAVSNLHLHKTAKTLREKGGKVIVIDPKRTKIAKQADLHIALMPGTDVVLALAIAAELENIGGIDRDIVDEQVLGLDTYLMNARQYTPEIAADICKIDADQIREMARMYKEHNPAALSVGIGPERNRSGGAGVRAALALPALASKFGVAGGGIVGKSGYAFPKTTERLQRPDLRENAARTINILDVPGIILDAESEIPIKGLFIYNHNPVSVHPDQNRMKSALGKEDLFTVGCDVVMTDSMLFADIILPACSHFEHDDIYAAYGQQYLQRAEPVIKPQGMALPNTEIFRRLAAEFGFTDSCFKESDKELIDLAFDADNEQIGGIKLSELPTDTSIEMKQYGEEAALFKTFFPKTPSEKVELFSVELREYYQQPLPIYKSIDLSQGLVLITPSSMKRTNAMFGNSGTNMQMQVLEMNPEDASARSLNDGDVVRVYNELAEIELKLKVTEDTRTGVVYCDKGAWGGSSTNKQTSNALIPDLRADLANGACYNDTQVEVACL